MAWRTLLVGVSISLGCAVGCGTSGSSPGEATRSTGLPIQGGTVDTIDPYAVGLCIGGVANGDCPYICSGALIAPNLVVTARHCVQEVPNPTQVNCATDSFFGPLRTTRVTTNYKLFQSTTGWHAVAKTVVPTDSPVCGNDLALLILKDNVPATEATPATPAVQYPLTDHTAYNLGYETAVGYGNTGPSVSDAGTRHVRRNIRIRCVPGDALIDCGDAGAGIFTDREFYTGDGTCSGDSGSSAYDQDSYDAKKPITFGVLSRGGEENGVCVGGIYTRLDSWHDLIVATAQQAATAGGYPVPAWTQPAPPKTDAGAKSDASTPPPPPPPATIGDACNTDADCASGVCVSPDGKTDDNVCSQECDATQPGSCPDGYKCSAGYCFVDSGGGGGNAVTTTKTSGCAVSRDPTHPVPWRSAGVAVAALLGLAFVRRRRR